MAKARGSGKAAPRAKSARGGGGRGKKALDAAAFARLPLAQRAAPIVVAVGDEPFFQAEVVRALAEALPGAERIDVLVDRRTEPAAILDELRSASLFNPRKLVVARGAEAFIDKAQEALLAFADSPPRGRSLALLVERLDGRTRFGKRAGEVGHVVQCKKLYAEVAPWERGPAWDTGLARWTAQRFEARGRELRVEDAYYLTQLTGDDLFEIDSTLDKLALLLGERPRVTLADIDALAGHTRRQNAFTIADAVASAEAGRAIGLLRAAFRSGLKAGSDTLTDSSGIGIVTFGAIHRSFGELARVRSYIESGGAADERSIASALGIAPFAVPRAVRHARTFRYADLGACFRALLRCDLGIKGRAGAEAALERLVGELCREARGARAT